MDCIRTSVLVGSLCLGTIIVPVFLTTNNNWVELLSKLEGWPPLGLCIGLLSIVVSQITVIGYHGLRPEGKLIQPSKVNKYNYWEGVMTHVSQPEGILLLGLYLCGTWMCELMSDSYYSFDGGIEWHFVIAQLVIFDVLQTIAHMIEHTFSNLYKSSHKPHHRFTSPRLFDAFNGSFLDTLLMIVAPLYATQCLVPANVWSYMTFGSVFSTWLVLIHSEWSHPWDNLFKKIGFGTPSDHHVHHAVFNHNFGHLFTYWDRMAGTYSDPEKVFKKKVEMFTPTSASTAGMS